MRMHHDGTTWIALRPCHWTDKISRTNKEANRFIKLLTQDQVEQKLNWLGRTE